MFESQRFHSCAAVSLSFQVFLMVISTPRFSFSIDEAFCAPTPFRCGHITNISYPFWASGRPRECSYPGFDLICEGGVPQIVIGSHAYQVNSIDYENQLLAVVDMDFVGKSCPLPSINATTDFSLFEYAPIDTNLTIYFNCPEPINYPFLSPLPCITEGRYAYLVLESGSDLGVYPFYCTCGVISLHRSLANNLKGNPLAHWPVAIEEGFTLKWIVDQGKCGICTQSSGQCGYNVTNPSEPICYCGGQSKYEKCPESGGETVLIFHADGDQARQTERGRQLVEAAPSCDVADQPTAYPCIALTVPKETPRNNARVRARSARSVKRTVSHCLYHLSSSAIGARKFLHTHVSSAYVA